MYVCLPASQAITFESLDVGSSYLHWGISPGTTGRVVCEGHRVKVNATGAKNVENSYSGNVKLRSAIAPVLSNTSVMFACSMGFSGTADRAV